MVVRNRKKRRRAESNRCTRFCKPVPKPLGHCATARKVYRNKLKRSKGLGKIYCQQTPKNRYTCRSDELPRNFSSHSLKFGPNLDSGFGRRLVVTGK